MAAPRLPGARPPPRCCSPAPPRSARRAAGRGSCPQRLGLSRLPLRRRRRRCAPTGDDVWLFTGCVMDAWLRDIHRATADVLDAVGRHRTRCPGAAATAAARCTSTPASPTQTRALARRVMESMPGDAPIVVNSAGCGAALKDYGHLLGTPEAAAFAAGSSTCTSTLAPRVDRLPPRGATSARSSSRTRATSATCSARTCRCAPCSAGRRHRRARRRRPVLRRRWRLLGAAAGARRRDPRAQAGARSSARRRRAVVASANPGCAMHLAAAGVTVRHPIDLVAEAIR